jgi:hypothetical protein
VGPTNDLYVTIVNITRDYLGPAAQRFIDRQITNHLDKKPDELESDDISKLIEWIRLAFSVLTEDSSIINEYIARLKSVSRERARH